MPTEALETLAKLVRYPQPGYAGLAGQCRARLASSDSEAAARLEPFERFVSQRTLSELEELFTQTFDMNPPAALEVGWHLFGENYDRGAFLVEMRGRLREHGVPEEGELPDHLGCILTLLGRLSAPEAGALAARVLPALEKMRPPLERAASPYAAVIATVETYVRNHFHPDPHIRIVAPAIRRPGPSRSSTTAGARPTTCRANETEGHQGGEKCFDGSRALREDLGFHV